MKYNIMWSLRDFFFLEMPAPYGAEIILFSALEISYVESIQIRCEFFFLVEFIEKRNCDWIGWERFGCDFVDKSRHEGCLLSIERR